MDPHVEHTRKLIDPQVELEKAAECLAARSPRSEEEDGNEKLKAQILNLNARLGSTWAHLVTCQTNVSQLQAKLKETIRAVERLAKGKSLGALGLPTEESWTHTN